jgi:AraC family transcriptional regulator of arabinose operon
MIHVASRIHQLSKSSIDLNLKNLEFTSLLHHLIYLMLSGDSGITINAKPQQRYIDYALAYMHNAYQSKITVNDIADYIHIDRTYLFQLFKKELNLSPQQYLIQFRIKKATQLLLETQESIKSIALAVGYSDYSLFCRTFKKIMGQAPSNWREQSLNSHH